MSIKIHHTAQVDETARLGNNTSVWNWVQVRENASIGENCILSKGVYIDFGVKIGNNVKIQNNVSVYHGCTIEDGVFIGPHVCFTNDKLPRAINPDLSLKSADDWQISPITVKKGASLGANSTILPGVTIGEWALVGSGSVVTKNVPNHGLVLGNPARLKGFVCRCGMKLEIKDKGSEIITLYCKACDEELEIPKDEYEKIQ